MRPLRFSEAVSRLSEFNISQHQVYLIDLVLLCEMAWADGKIQDAEVEILHSYLNHHVNSINRLAGCQVIDYSQAKEFVNSFLQERPDPQLLHTIREVIPAVRIDNRETSEAEKTRLDILNACLDIAASSVTKYPYGLKERFTAEEKNYYHTIEKILIGNRQDRF